MTPFDRLILGALSAATGVGCVLVMAYAAPILRWQLSVIDWITALFS